MKLKRNYTDATKKKKKKDTTSKGSNAEEELINLSHGVLLSTSMNLSTNGGDKLELHM
jgi:hypothetical protein